ncbi:MAG: hypothetical protein H8E44_39190 [Planctomycetes bacterium]|nr:hypothetical protein [Planctomycetota bacterium]MBL7040143.1 hypothetical protein [Pirellulaceae bacterium]
MSYDHTQKAPLHLIFYPIVVILLVLAWIGRDQQPVVLCTLGVALTLVLVALMFKQLTVRDEGECLAIRYGPLPVFRKLILYSDMSSVESGRSAVIDGWGIHWIPGRGFTYNLWGFDCAILMVKGRIIRVGSDDAENLVAFLREKVGHPPTAEQAETEVDASDDRT